MTTTTRPLGLIETIRSIVGMVRCMVHVRRWFKQHGYKDWNALIEHGTVDDITGSFSMMADQVQGLPGADDRWTMVHRLLNASFERMQNLQWGQGRALGRETVFVDVAGALFEQGFPPSMLLADSQSRLRWLLREPAIYRRIIGSMTMEDLNARPDSRAPAWYAFLIASSGAETSTAHIDAMLEQVDLLLRKGIDVSVERLHDLIDNAPAETYPSASRVSGGLREVAKERRRREHAALTQVADEAMAEASEATPEHRARARL